MAMMMDHTTRTKISDLLSFLLSFPLSFLLSAKGIISPSLLSAYLPCLDSSSVGREPETMSEFASSPEDPSAII